VMEDRHRNVMLGQMPPGTASGGWATLWSRITRSNRRYKYGQKAIGLGNGMLCSRIELGLHSRLGGGCDRGREHAVGIAAQQVLWNHIPS
jgi:hypothetical protein